jgi:hypothetical protein
MPSRVTPATSLDSLRKTAKRWLKQLRANDPDARARFERAYPTGPERPVLRDVQHALAREYGHEDWTTLKRAVERPDVERPAPAWRTLTAEEYERLADDLVLAFDAHDQPALQRLNEHYHRSFTFDDLWAEVWRRVYAFRQRSFAAAKNYLQPTEARILIAQDAGFGSWGSLRRAVTTGAPGPHARRQTPDGWICTTDSRVQQRHVLPRITVYASSVMTWLGWLGLAVLIAAVAAVTGIKPRGTRHVAHTRLMGVARVALLALIIIVIVAYFAFGTRSAG